MTDLMSPSAAAPPSADLVDDRPSTDDHPLTDERPSVEAPDVPAADAQEADAGTEAGAGTDGPPADEDARRPGRVRRVLRVVASALAVGTVFAALATPSDLATLHASTYVRIPLDGLLLVGLLMAMPARFRRPAVVLAGVVLGLATILKVVDIGFRSVLDRPFDLVLDWGLLGDAAGVVEDSIGHGGAVVAQIGAILLVGLLLVGSVLAVRRVSRLATSHRLGAVRVLTVLGIAWVSCAAAGAQFTPGVPIADRNTTAAIVERGQQIPAGLRDHREFTRTAAVDAYRDTPSDQLLTGLRGKDVVISFVESYGRSAIEDPRWAPTINPTLDAGSERLRQAGFASRSAFLTSSTVGGSSWLAHASTMSGLWIDNQQRYRTLTGGDRFTLPAAFNKAGWRTVSLEPAIDGPWPEREFYGYDEGYDLNALGYQGPRFSYATMPDQYTLNTFQQRERRPGHKPVMAEITLVSSHSPWTPIPRMIDWDAVGDGSIYNQTDTREGKAADSQSGTPGRLRATYGPAINYSLSALISYVEKYGDDDLVLVFLGDHQAAPLVTGPGAGRDVPITVVAKDPKVLDQITGWGWQDGLRPRPDAPVWPMDTFRDRFLSAFG